MAKFKTNHVQQGKGGIGCVTPILLVGMILLLVFAMWQYPELFDMDEEEKVSFPDTEIKNYEEERLFFLPKGTSTDIIRHRYYALAYNEQYELAEWVAYELTRNQLNNNSVRREDSYRSDPKVETGSANIQDYRGSGYDRGHLLPVADRKFNFEAMDETFYMSNIAPQIHAFNGGIWRELEELVRDWAIDSRKIYVVTGPILTQPSRKRIGDNKVMVPKAYYKVILDIADPELKGIGFVLPNERSDKSLQLYAMSIDEVETITGIDFFPDLVEDDLEEMIESSFDNRQWQYNELIYQTRIYKWNEN